MHKSIVVIGTGLAGYMFAKELRRLDDTSTLTMITACDGTYYSKPLLSNALTQKRAPAALAMSSAEEMASQLNATILTHTQVDTIDTQEKRIVIDGQEISYDTLILACGSRPKVLPFAREFSEVIFSVNDLEAYRSFRQALTDKSHITILGSGLVGCEFANDLIHVGYKVTVISFDAYPLVRLLPIQLARVLQDALREKGVVWHFDRGVTQVVKEKHGYRLMLDNNTSEMADILLSAIGILPQVALARASGLRINQGIVVDRYLRTSNPHIYALGDCAEVSGYLKQYVAPLLQCTPALAKNLTGGSTPVVYPGMPIVIKTPALPVVSLPPEAHIEGEWSIEGEGRHLRALFYDQQKILHGFALTGDLCRERMALAKQLPSLF